MKNVDKAVFPKLLAQLWKHLSSKNAWSGLRGTGLCPLDKAVIPKEKIIDHESSETLEQQPGPSDESPHKLLRQAIMKTISPEISDSNKAALEDS